MYERLALYLSRVRSSEVLGATCRCASDSGVAGMPHRALNYFAVGLTHRDAGRGVNKRVDGAGDMKEVCCGLIDHFGTYKAIFAVYLVGVSLCLTQCGRECHCVYCRWHGAFDTSFHRARFGAGIGSARGANYGRADDADDMRRIHDA